MTDQIRVGETADPVAPSEQRPHGRSFVAMSVGNATVYVEQSGDVVDAWADDRIYPVAPLTPQGAFETASDILRECVRVVGERFEALAEVRPQEVTVEFTVTFEVKGKASVIPVFVTGETGAQTGLKVTAKWKRSEARSP